MKFLDYFKTHILCLDGGMGTLLQEKGLCPGEDPALWNLLYPERIEEIHKAYLDAGSNVICTNTFGANLLHFSKEELEKVICSAVQIAHKAQKKASSENSFVALDIGPLGKLLKPLGDLDFEEAVSIFAETVNLGVKCGVDLILIETMNDSLETKAALLAAKENSDLPVLVSNAYGEDGKLMTGASPRGMVAMLEGLGADGIGANCSMGPDQLFSVAKELLEFASVPVFMKPNAGLPKSIGGKTVYDITPEEFAEKTAEMVKVGVRAVGGCCGTTPETIRLLKEKIAMLPFCPVEEKNVTVVSSYAKTAVFGESPVLIGERINPTGKKKLKEALLSGDMAYLLNEGIRQQEAGVQILDVNVGLPEIDEVEMLSSVVTHLQAVSDLPLQIDTASPAALEKALRLYNGKAMINSVNGKEESMKAVFPLAKKYGGVIVCLTLDEKGIPFDAEGRFAIAEKIYHTAKSYGISPKNLVFDALAMTVSADPMAALITLKTLKMIRERLGCHTSLGVSNISFGLPGRDSINSTFFALALENGLSAAIMNPFSAAMMKTYWSYRALKGMDENFAEYIAAAESFAEEDKKALKVEKSSSKEGVESLRRAIVKGLGERAKFFVKMLLEEKSPLDILHEEIIPALDEVGKGYEEKRVYLPQLLMSAEAAKCACSAMETAWKTGGQGQNGATFVLATVKGDIHDIGKNIVGLLLENYGFTVKDLGKDVPPELVLETVMKTKAPLLGLSALMTTTVPAMEETVRLVRKNAPWCHIVVGGAVLTEEYARRIGADYYAKDAMAAVRYGESVIEKIK